MACTGSSIDLPLLPRAWFEAAAEANIHFTAYCYAALRISFGVATQHGLSRLDGKNCCHLALHDFPAGPNLEFPCGPR